MPLKNKLRATPSTRPLAIPRHAAIFLFLSILLSHFFVVKSLLPHALLRRLLMNESTATDWTAEDLNQLVSIGADGTAQELQALIDAHKTPFPAGVVDVLGHTPLFYAASKGNAPCVEILLSLCDPNASGVKGQTPLMAAVGSFGFFGNGGDRAETVRLLLPVSDPLAQDVAGTTALLAAAACAPDDQPIRLLLPVSDATHANIGGANALMFRSGRRHLATANNDIVAELAAACDPRQADEHGQTALIFAASVGNAEAVKILTPLSDVNHADVEGCTALMRAAMWKGDGNLKCCQILGPLSNAQAVGEEGLPAFSLALDNGAHANADALAHLMPLDTLRHALSRLTVFGFSPTTLPRAFARVEAADLAQTVVDANTNASVGEVEAGSLGASTPDRAKEGKKRTPPTRV